VRDSERVELTTRQKKNASEARLPIRRLPLCPPELRSYGTLDGRF
jgi:hypothetical protein